jgi:hypothetical protein
MIAIPPSLPFWSYLAPNCPIGAVSVSVPGTPAVVSLFFQGREVADHRQQLLPCLRRIYRLTYKNPANRVVIKDSVTYQIYFRFNAEGKIDVVQSIGEGWIC